MTIEKFSSGLSLVIPVFNEINGIDSSLAAIEKLIELIDFPIEVLVVNDGSSDGTEKVLNTLEKNTTDIKVIHHPYNRGYGAALKTGIKNAKYNYIAITDADETYPNERIPEFYKMIIEKDFDMLVGARVGKNVKIPLIRRPAKWMINKLANYLSDVKIPDLNSGLRIMKRSVLEKFVHILPEGFSFTTTITLSMLTNGYRVHYEKIDYFHRAGSSKIRPIYDTLNFIQLIIRTVLLFRPLKVFLPLSGFMFLVGLVLIGYRLTIDASFGVTATVIMIGALQVLAIGMLADLIDRRMS
jgi:glycosyltransferase involved in cell wall biosynthesis